MPQDQPPYARSPREADAFKPGTHFQVLGLRTIAVRFVWPVNFGERATDWSTYFDRRSELWWLLRDWIRDEACPADAPARAREMLPGDLTTPKYEQRSDGRLKLEAKKDMKKRLGISPDDGEALALALAHCRERQWRSASSSLRGV